MKKILILLSFLPFLTFSQAINKTNEINWMDLSTAQVYSKKYNKNILIFFHKPNCEFCDKMKSEALINNEVINLNLTIQKSFSIKQVLLYHLI